MFKTLHRMKARKDRGFTLIELLIVVAIIGILASIAVPAFLGQREKAKVRTVEAGAKGSVAEIQGLIDSVTSLDPFIILNSEGNQTCIQSAVAQTKSCQAIYNIASSGMYTDMNSILTYVINHHQGKNEKSPFNAQNYLFTQGTTPQQGGVLITLVDERTVRVQAFAVDTVNAIFDTNITAR